MSVLGRIVAHDDPAAAERIAAHAPLVRRIARHVHARVGHAARIEVEDLIQTGMIALVEAAHHYEDRGHAFATYASIRIRGAMIDQLRRDATMCRSALANRRQIVAHGQRLAQQLGRSATPAEMAVALGMTLSDYRTAFDSAVPVREQSLDGIYSDHLMGFADQEEAADDRVARAQQGAALAAAIAALPAREGQILQMFFVDECGLDEIGSILGIGAARVCQIKKAALAKVRAMLAERELDV